MASRRMTSRRTITGSLSDIQKRLKYVEARSSPSRLANQVVKRVNVQPRAISTDQIALSAITNSLIEAGTITANEIGPNAITNVQLAPNSVNTENFRVGAVDSNAIAAETIQQSNMAANSVGRTQIIPSAVGRDELASNSVTGIKIVNDAITTDKVNNFAITTDKIGPGAITSGKIGAGQVSSGALGANVVTSSKINTGAITTNAIADFAISSIKIQRNSPILTGLTAGTGINSTTSEGPGRAGTRYTLSIDLGTASNQAARGNHTHALGTVSTLSTGFPTAGISHTHNFTRFTTALATTSTLRAKKDISDYEIDDPRRILALRPRRYKYRNSKRELQDSLNREWMYGYIAEEVQEAGIEEVLGYDEKGLVDSINYGLISMLLLELVRLQQDEIDSIKQEIIKFKEEQ